MKIKLRKRFDIIMSTKPVFFKFNFGGGGYSPADPPCLRPWWFSFIGPGVVDAGRIYLAENNVHYWVDVNTVKLSNCKLVTNCTRRIRHRLH
jgi:hypothetical protein